MFSLKHFTLQKTCLLCRLPIEYSKNTSSHAPNSHLKKPASLCHYCIQSLPYNLISCELCAIPLNNTQLDGIQGSRLLCGDCQATPPNFDRALACFLYAHPMNKVLSAFKYKGRTDFTRALAQLVFQAIEHTYHGNNVLPECLIPIPLHRFREFKRGYNQAELLAKEIARLVNVPMDITALERRRSTQKQARLSKQERIRNVHNVFRYTTKKSYRHVALIDDVMTTGATVSAACKLIKQAGVERVDIWCCARASIN